MCITNKQKEGERWMLSQPNYSHTKSSSHVTYKYNSICLFLHKAPSFLLSLIIFALCSLLCFLFYGWCTLFYFFKFSISRGVEEDDERSKKKDVVIEEVKKDCDFLAQNNYVPLNDEEIEEKEIMEKEMVAEEAQIEEEDDLVDDGKTEDVIMKPDVDNDQGCKEISLVRPLPWLSLCGMLEVFLHQKGYDWHDQ